jgi:hypothetical protein
MFQKTKFIITSILMCLLMFYACSIKKKSDVDNLDNKVKAEDCQNLAQELDKLTIVSLNLGKLNQNMDRIDLEKCDLCNDSLVSLAFQKLLLRLYAFHLQKADQGYNLLEMNTGEIGRLLECYLNANELKNNEFVNSGVILETTQHYKGDNFIDSLHNVIEVEQNRLLEDNNK